jgi:hypothetical protein
MCVFTHTVAGQESRPAPPRAPSLVVIVPELMSTDDLQWYARLLSLASPQIVLLEQIHARYETAATTFLRDQAPALSALAADAGAARTPVVTFEGAALTTQLRRLEQQVAARIKALDEDVVVKLSQVCSEPQLAQLDRVRWHRERARSRCGKSSLFVPGAKVDLAGLVQALVKDDPTLEIEAAQEVLMQYELAATGLFAGIQRAFWDEREKLHDLEARISTTSASGAPDAAVQIQQMMNEYPRIFADKTRLQIALADLNKQYVARISATLPNSLARVFEALALANIYPAVYPDTTAPTDLLRRIVEHDASTSTNARTLVDNYRLAYEAICQQMCQRADKWHEHHALTNSTDEFSAFSVRMRELRESRWRLNEQILNQLQSVLPAEMRGSVEPELVAARKKVETAIARGRNDQYPPMR